MNKLSKIENVIFDWSGTLCNDVPYSVEVFNHVRTRLGMPRYTEEQWVRAWCLPVDKFNREQFPETTPERLDVLYRQANMMLAHRRHMVKAMPSAPTILNYLAKGGISCFVFSAAPQEVVKEQAQHIGVSRFLRRVYGGHHDKMDTLPQVVRICSLAANRTLYVGDTPHDIEAGRAARCITAAVCNGYTPQTELEKAAPNILVQDLSQLQALIMQAKQ